MFHRPSAELNSYATTELMIRPSFGRASAEIRFNRGLEVSRARARNGHLVTVWLGWPSSAREFVLTSAPEFRCGHRSSQPRDGPVLGIRDQSKLQGELERLFDREVDLDERHA